MPIMEKIVHTAKQTVKEMVDSQSARFWSPEVTLLRSCMGLPGSSVGIGRCRGMAQRREPRLDVGQPELVFWWDAGDAGVIWWNQAHSNSEKRDPAPVTRGRPARAALRPPSSAASGPRS